MFTSLHISNYALIANLEIDFERGFSVITGETGAGKSIILGALGLVMGGRADTKTIRQGKQKCIIEAEFDISNFGLQDFFALNDLDYSPHCIIRRELNQNGKSRSFVNDTPIGLTPLKQLADQLIDIHSQHQNLQLAKDDFQRQIIDHIAANEVVKRQYTEAYNHYLEAKQFLNELQEKAQKTRSDQDYIEFQLSQLDEAQLKDGEATEIESEIQALSHAQEIKTSLLNSLNILSGDNSVVEMLREAVQNMNRSQRYLAQAEKLTQRIRSTAIEIKDIADEIEQLQRNTEYDPLRQQQLEERLDLLNTLMSKHQVDSDTELITLRDQLRQQLTQMQSYDDMIEEAKKNLQSAEAKLEIIAAELSQTRHAVKNRTEQQITDQLLQLGIKHAQFQIQITRLDHYAPSGIDQIEFMFAANKNQQLQNVVSVASGGEMSRIMLAIKSVNRASQNKEFPTIIFDEIDTGVSGEIADSMAKIMENMAQTRQIISITHLPQIASRGTEHYKVYKSDNEQSTETHIQHLTSEQRINEIATMLSGNSITQTAIDNAKELLSRQ